MPDYIFGFFGSDQLGEAKTFDQGIQKDFEKAASFVGIEAADQNSIENIPAGLQSGLRGSVGPVRQKAVDALFAERAIEVHVPLLHFLKAAQVDGMQVRCYLHAGL